MPSLAALDKPMMHVGEVIGLVLRDRQDAND